MAIFCESSANSFTRNFSRKIIFYFRFCRQFDIREPHKCRTDNKVLLVGLQNHIGLNAEAKCIAVNQRRPEQIAVGANDVYARVYDRRMITLTQVERETVQSNAK